MLLHLPERYAGLEKLPLSLAKRLVFCDPYACAVFQHERMCDIGEAQLFRVIMAKEKCEEAAARKQAVEAAFERAVIFGLGTTGLFIGDQIRRNHPEAKLLFIARSDETAAKVRFARKYIGADYLCSAGLSEETSGKPPPKGSVRLPKGTARSSPSPVIPGPASPPG